MLNQSDTVEGVLATCSTLREYNLEDYKDTEDPYFKGKVDAYTLVINLIEALEKVKKEDLDNAQTTQ